MISIIIRTKNEERWIGACLENVFKQKYKDFEVIIVDNNSADKTVEKAKQFPVKKIINCLEYLPGKALNIGMKEAIGDFAVCLSGHCIPVNDEWLGNLLSGFDSDLVAGVYGRQEPMTFTPDADKRDLALVFGLDRKIQIKDSFFHNANSMIRRGLWEKAPFDENVTNIEDRVWAKEMQARGFKILYEPLASVYHYHGIHQDGNPERCANVVRILERLHDGYEYKTMDINKMNIVAIIPVRGKVRDLGGKPLLSYTVERALSSKYIKKVIVSTDCKQTQELAEKMGAEAPFLRDCQLSEAHVNLASVYKYSIDKIEEAKIFPDIVVCLEETFPFREECLIDDMITQLVKNGYDSVLASRVENKAIWKEDGGNIVQIVEGITPRQFKEPVFVELKGVGCVTHPEFLRRGEILGKKVGIYKIDDPYSYIEVRENEDFKMASLLVKDFFKGTGNAGKNK